MERLKRIFLHFSVFIVLALIYIAIIVSHYGFGIISFTYFLIIYALVELLYYSANKKWKFLTKRINKITFIISTVVTLIILFGVIFATVDYILVKNSKSPIFTMTSYGFEKSEAFIGSDEKELSGYRYNATEYYGLGYKIVTCDSCKKSIYFMPLGIGNYEWSVGIPIDRLNGTWYHPNSNDIYLSFDGVGNYTFISDTKVSGKGTYTILDNSVLIKSSSGYNIGNCTIEDDYRKLKCDNYVETFLK